MQIKSIYDDGLNKYFEITLVMINNNIVRMEEVLNEKEQEIKKNYKPDPKLLECSICS